MLYFDAPMPVRSGPGGGNTAGPGGGSGSLRFSIELEQVPKMIAGLKEAIAELIKLQGEAERLQLSGAPGPDPYSGYATLAMRQVAGNDPGGYGWANLEAQKALEKTIANIEKSIAEYKGTDEAANTALS